MRSILIKYSTSNTNVHICMFVAELSWFHDVPLYIQYPYTIHMYTHKSHFELISTKRYLLIKFSICSFICPRHLGTGCVSMINWIFPRVVKFVINQSLNFQSLIFMLFSFSVYTYFNNVMLTLTEWFSADKTNTKYLLKIRIWMKVWCGYGIVSRLRTAERGAWARV